jgi:hypothetical protein
MTVTHQPVALTLAPEGAYRVHFLALASAGRASIAYARRLVRVSTPAYAERVRLMACGAQDGESDRTESLRSQAEFAWGLAETIGAAITATYPAADGGWGSSLRGAAQVARALVGFIEARDDVAADEMYRHIESISEQLDIACATYSV